MERNRRIYSAILNLSASSIAAIYGCTREPSVYCDNTAVEIIIGCPTFEARSIVPDESKISDINLMIFDDRGQLEFHKYLENGATSCNVTLLKGGRYSMFACANTGSPIKAGCIDDLNEITYHMAYPDEYRTGIPMYAASEHIIAEDSVIRIELSRLMAKISIRMDRSRLSDGVEMNVTHVRIGNCPKYVRVFSPSAINDKDGCFTLGFHYNDTECAPLNETGSYGLSGELSLYMLENMQSASYGDYINTCSYIEMELEYSSRDYISSDGPLIYRFYLGEDRKDIERNCHYHITISPEDDGLKGDGWKVDKSGIVYCGKTVLRQYPSDYIVGNIGDTIHIGCILQPVNADFDIGLQYLEADKKAGIYDYEIDDDGHGVTLTLTGPGRGLIYMEAGEPINDAALFMIEVNSP